MVDLEALAVDLSDAGFTCLIEHDRLYADLPSKPNAILRRYVVTTHGHIHLGKRVLGEWCDTVLILKTDWPNLDIIRRHLTEAGR